MTVVPSSTPCLFSSLSLGCSYFLLALGLFCHQPVSSPGHSAPPTPPPVWFPSGSKIPVQGRLSAKVCRRQEFPTEAVCKVGPVFIWLSGCPASLSPFPGISNFHRERVGILQTLWNLHCAMCWNWIYIQCVHFLTSYQILSKNILVKCAVRSDSVRRDKPDLGCALPPTNWFTLTPAPCPRSWWSMIILPSLGIICVKLRS